ncbi:MAG: RluA family pseudouridine synthase [Dehalococcoidia bacterium]
MTTETRHHFDTPRRDRLDRLVAEAVPEISRSQAQRLIEQGQVTAGGAVVTRASHLVEEGVAVEVAIPVIEVDEAAAQVPLEILYEDEHVLVVDKPWGILVHAVPGVPGLSIVDVIRARYPDATDLQDGDYRAGVVHRLDRDTTGVLAFAKTEVARDTLKDQWRARETLKEYIAIVEGHVEPAAGIVDAPLGPDPTDSRRRGVVEVGESAYTEYRVREQYGDEAALVDVRIRTGRTHQIRVHLEAIGYPVMGDTLYGRRSDHIGRQALHAARLGFRLPSTGEWREFTSPLPDDMQHVIDTLRAKYAAREDTTDEDEGTAS